MGSSERLRTAVVRSVVILGACTLAACGAVVDEQVMAEELTAGIPELAGVSTKVTSVECPVGEEFVADNTFTCEYVVEDGSDGVAEVTILSAEGDGKYEYGVVRWASGQMEQFLLENTEVDVPLTGVECPKTIEDGTVCTFEDEDGDTGTMGLAIDKDGNVTSDPKFD